MQAPLRARAGARMHAGLALGGGREGERWEGAEACDLWSGGRGMRDGGENRADIVLDGH